MPTFCRHNRFVENCPICREPEPAAKPVSRARRPASSGGARTGAMTVRRAQRSADDGYRTRLAPGLRATADGARLAQEIGFAAARLELLAGDPPGLYAEVAREADSEEAIWLAFLIAYLGPVEDAQPFAAIAAARTSWASGELPALEGVAGGPRGAQDDERGPRALLAYRDWARRTGGQAAGLAGEPYWSAERRFARDFERLALPGLHRAARFDFLTVLGATGRVELRAASLFLGDDRTTLAAKRVFGIGDTLLLDRRARSLAEACDVPLAALDLALFNWQDEDARATLGVPATEEASEAAQRAHDALGTA